MIIWRIIKQSALDVWEEMLYLVLFNVICLVGMLLIIPWPFVTFALFFTLYDISQGKGIKLNTFIAHGRRMWKPAYIWGGMNLLAAVIFWTNLNFYSSFRAQWALIMQVLFLSLTVFWTILQLIILPLYPRLSEPSFKLALRNGAIVMGRYPLVIFVLVVFVVLIVLLAFLFPPIAFLIALVAIAAMANRTVEAAVERELTRGQS